MSVQFSAILEFSDSWGQRKRAKADYLAVLARSQGMMGRTAENREKLLKEARAWAKPKLRTIASEVQDVFELKEQVANRTWDEFVQSHRYYELRPDYLEFESALWEEEWLSLEDRAIRVFRERAASAAKTQSPNDSRPSAERLLKCFGEDLNEAIRRWLNPARDRWFKSDGFKP